MPKDALPPRGFMASMSTKADEEYEAAFNEALNGCLNCDLFAWLDHQVSCRMDTDPVQCGGPYRRVT